MGNLSDCLQNLHEVGFFISESAKIYEQLTKKFELDHVLCVQWFGWEVLRKSSFFAPDSLL